MCIDWFSQIHGLHRHHFSKSLDLTLIKIKFSRPKIYKMSDVAAIDKFSTKYPSSLRTNIVEITVTTNIFFSLQWY